MSKEKRIFERNPDTGAIRSRKFGDYGNETYHDKGDEDQDEGLYKDNIRENILSDVWAANKRVVDGKWFVELSQVAEIIGGSANGK